MKADANTFTTDDELPRLYIAAPKCSHCLNEVYLDDGYASCETCHVQWDEISEDAVAVPDENQEGAEVPCALTPNQDGPREYYHSGKHWSLGPKQPCILPSGHEGEHLNPYTITTTPAQEG